MKDSVILYQFTALLSLSSYLKQIAKCLGDDVVYSVHPASETISKSKRHECLPRLSPWTVLGCMAHEPWFLFSDQCLSPVQLSNTFSTEISDAVFDRKKINSITKSRTVCCAWENFTGSYHPDPCLCQKETWWYSKQSSKATWVSLQEIFFQFDMAWIKYVTPQLQWTINKPRSPNITKIWTFGLQMIEIIKMK